MNDADPAAVLEALQPPEPEQPIEVLAKREPDETIESQELAVPETKPKPEIAIVDGKIRLATFEDAIRFAKFLDRTGLAPTSFKGVAQITLAILQSLELGIPVLQGLQGMAVIKGQITVRPELGLAMVQPELDSKKTEYEGEGESRSCTQTLKRKGRGAHSYSFNIQDAQRAGLLSSPAWRSYPDRMLYHRALGFALRGEFPDIIKGLYLSDELQDHPELNKKS